MCPAGADISVPDRDEDPGVNSMDTETEKARTPEGPEQPQRQQPQQQQQQQQQQ